MSAPAGPPLPAGGPYGLGPLLGGSLAALGRNLGAFGTAALLPLALLLLKHLLAGAVGAEPPALTVSEGEGSLRLRFQPGGGLGPLGLLLDAVAATLFAVAWHRFLLGHEAPRPVPRLAARHLRFLGLALLLGLLPMAPLVLAGWLEQDPEPGFQGLPALLVLLGLVWFLPGLYLALRWSLTLPAAAVDVALTRAQSWQATRGKAAPLILAPLLAGLLVFAASAVAFLLLGGLAGPTGGEAPEPAPGGGLALLFQAVGELAFLAELALFAGILSLAVTRLVPDPGALPAPAA
jgi:hypothetical protein